MNAIMIKMASNGEDVEAKEERVARQKKAKKIGSVIGSGMYGALVGDIAHTYAANKAYRSEGGNIRDMLALKGVHRNSEWAKDTGSKHLAARATGAMVNHGGKIIGGAIGAGRELLKQRRENNR